MAACRYAELTARLAALRPDQAVMPAPLTCVEVATHRVRIEERGLGIASWTIAEVCVMCAHMARDLPGFLGNAWPIRPGSPIATTSPIPAALTNALRPGTSP